MREREREIIAYFVLVILNWKKYPERFCGVSRVTGAIVTTVDLAGKPPSFPNEKQAI